LWDIAARLLGTDDSARVARYWPRIHRANRAVIGADPSLIIPGTVLELPYECR
jgi:nucleoid-associated protein YgaU